MNQLSSSFLIHIADKTHCSKDKQHTQNHMVRYSRV